tara:strand:- start:5614 stop:7929 length:2316 start_codon:yes stop_codon:yes gene_type:complete
MTSSFRSTAFQSAASPVDTFVAEPRVLPKTNAEELAGILASVNPALQSYIGQKLDQTKQEQEQLGMEKVMQASKPELKRIINQVNKQDGSKAARQLIGGNVFFRSGVEKQLAITLGGIAETKTKNFFQNYTVQKQLNDGTTINVPLEQYGVDSAEFQTALGEYSSTQQSDVSGIRSLYVNKYFLPQQNQALQKIHLSHQEKHNEFNVQNAENKIGDTLKSTFYKIEENQELIDKGILEVEEGQSGIDMSRRISQGSIDELVSQGLASSVSPTKMLEIVSDTANSIFLEFEDQGLDGYDEAKNFLDYAGELKVGPKQITKNGTVKQSQLKTFYEDDIRKLRVDLLNASEKFRDEEEREATQKRQDLFLNEIKQYGFFQVVDGKKNRDRLNKLAKQFPEELDFLQEKIEIEDFSRDDWFINFENDLRFKGEYDNDPVKAYKTLIEFEQSLGVTITSEDKTNLQRLKTEIEDTLGKGLYTNRSLQIKDNLKTAKELIGEKDVRGIVTLGKQETTDFYDAEQKYINEIRRIESKADSKEKEALIKEATIQLFVDAEKIKVNKYNTSGIMSEVQQRLIKEGIKQKPSFLNDGVLENNPFNTNNKKTPKTGAELFFGGKKDNVEGGAFSEPTKEDIRRETKLDQTEKLDQILTGIDKTKKIPQTKIEEMLLAVGFKAEDAKIMAAVSMAESAGNPMIDTVKSGLDPEKTNEFSIGLFQLNMGDAFLEERLRLFDIKSTDELYDPIVNVIAAKRLFDQQGFGAWGAYTNGTYKDFLSN